MTSPNLDIDQIYRLLTTGTTAGMERAPYTRLRREEFKRATEEGFFTVKRQPPGMGIIWFEWCSQQDHPFLVLIPKRWYATIGLDMFSTYPQMLSEGAFREVRQKLHNLELEWSGSASFVKITAPLSEATPFAKWLLDLAVSDKWSWGSRRAG